MPQGPATHPTPSFVKGSVPSEAGVAPQNPSNPHTPAASLPYSPAPLPALAGGVQSKFSEQFISFSVSFLLLQFFTILLCDSAGSIPKLFVSFLDSPQNQLLMQQQQQAHAAALAAQDQLSSQMAQQLQQQQQIMAELMRKQQEAAEKR